MFERQAGTVEGGSDTAKWAVKTSSLETACLTWRHSVSKRIVVGGVGTYLSTGTLQQVLTEPGWLSKENVIGEPGSAGRGAPEVLGEDLVPVNGVPSQGLLGVEANTEEEGRGQLDCGHAQLFTI